MINSNIIISQELNMKVLFLSVETGGGHRKAAEAVAELILLRHPGSEIHILDTIKYASQIADKLITGSYLKALKLHPGLYGMLYRLSLCGGTAYTISKAINILLSARLEKLLQSFEPSVIVCTHPFPLQMVSHLKAVKKISAPIVEVITDYTPHPFCIQPGTDAYVVAHQYIKDAMIKKGIPGEIIHPLGIPVADRFKARKSRLEILKDLGLEDITTVLVMGGSLGFGEIGKIFGRLSEFDGKLQIIAVAGKNPSLRTRLERLSHKNPKKILILGYTNLVADLMDAADFIITKPGGITIAEALAKELPLLITSPIPGQEDENANFLINHGAALKIRKINDANNTIQQILKNPLRIRHLKEMARHLSKPDSSHDMVSLLEKLLKDPACPH